MYIHLKHEENGDSALKGLSEIFKYLEKADKSILYKFCKFKICSLGLLRDFADSIVMFCADFETARSIAIGLEIPLQGLVDETLPRMVKRISPGIGISTEPETSFDDKFKALAPFVSTEKFSYGSHRSGLIAKGLINASRGRNFILPVIDICFKEVALAFSNAGVDVYKPYHTGSLPPLDD